MTRSLYVLTLTALASFAGAGRLFADENDSTKNTQRAAPSARPQARFESWLPDTSWFKPQPTTPKAEEGVPAPASDVSSVVSTVVMNLPRRSSARKVAARVNGKPILRDDVVRAVAPELTRLTKVPASRDLEARVQVLFDQMRDQCIDRELLYQEAVGLLKKNNPEGLKKLKQIQKQEFENRLRQIKADNHLTEKQFLDGLQQSGMTLDQMKQMEEHRFIADEYLRSRIWPVIQSKTTYPYVLEYYDHHPGEFQRPDSVDWEDIFVAVGTKRNPTWEGARRWAESAARRLRNGESVSRLLDLDDGDSKARGGEGYGHEKSQINPPPLAEQLFQMKAGPDWRVVKISTGFHIVRVSRRVYAGQAPLNNETREAIVTKLQRSIAERESKRIVQELRAKAVIELVQDTASTTR
jgi:peptidyl-prolyl cis-trans isomerase SurA